MIRGYPNIVDLHPFKYLSASRNNKLQVSEVQELTGEDVCNKRGAIYIYHCTSEVSIEIHTYI